MTSGLQNQAQSLMKGEANTVFYFETAFKGYRHPHYGRLFDLGLTTGGTYMVTGADGTKGAERVVTVELEKVESGTAVRLDHTGFPR